MRAGRVLFAAVIVFLVAAFSGCAGARTEGKTESEPVGAAENVMTSEAAAGEETEAKEAAVEVAGDAPGETAEAAGGEAEAAGDATEAAGVEPETVEEKTEAAVAETEADGDATEAAGEETVTFGDADDGGETTVERSFYAEEIPEDVFEGMQGKSYKADCPIPRSDLRYLHVLHKTLEGETQEGVMVCHKAVAGDLLEIFEELYDEGYPIERMRLVDEYDAIDESSMADNNSSCFNYRVISHTNTISKHGLGVAVDINPLYNPYTKIVEGARTVEPANGEPYLDREADFPYKIDENDLCYRLFIEHGFEWGGAWRSSKDYQHFELSGTRLEEVRSLY